MKQRIITGVSGATALLIIIWLGGWWYSSLVFLIATLAFVEYAQMNGFKWNQPQVILTLLIVWTLLIDGLNAFSQLSYLQTPNNILIGMVLLYLLILISRNQFDLQKMSYLFMGSIYIGFGFSFMIQTIWKENGTILTLLILFVIWANDSAAYFIGKYFGERKLFPAISPNKTIEGSLAGIGCGVLVGVILTFIFPELGSFAMMIVVTTFISVVGQTGDLIESAWKRTLQVKDSGSILPGHGGILDRFDSLLFAFVVLYLVQII